MSFEPAELSDLEGGEPFDGLDADVLDFWRFAMGDLRTNNVRGYLSEFFVARAVGSNQKRVEWDPWDVTAPDGTRIEVKTSAYLQSWAQRTLSRPRFSVPRTFGWDAATNSRSTRAEFNADVYVFCLHEAKTHEEYDPLSLAQWTFYVAGRSAIEAHPGVSMGLSTLSRIAGEPVAYAELGAEIRRVAATEKST